MPRKGRVISCGGLCSSGVVLLKLQSPILCRTVNGQRSKPNPVLGGVSVVVGMEEPVVAVDKGMDENTDVK